MRRRDSGLLLYVNSPASIVAWPGAAGYTAARWALRGFVESLRAELYGTGLRVATAIPGKVSSSYFANNPGVEERFPGLARLLPALTPEQAAARIVRGIERGERMILMPRLLKLLYLAHAVAPGPVRWLAVATGARRQRVP
jgi:short-subunit dehydrogenase